MEDVILQNNNSCIPIKIKIVNTPSNLSSIKVNGIEYLFSSCQNAKSIPFLISEISLVFSPNKFANSSTFF